MELDKQKINAFLNLYKENKTFLCGIISLIIFLISIIFNFPITLCFSSIILFAVFDILGFHYVLTRKGTETPLNDNLIYTSAYRIIQTGFQIMLFLVCSFISMWAALGFIILWWFGLADLLFYIFLDIEDLEKYENMFWLKWTIFGIFTKNITGKILITYSILGMFIVFISIFYFQFVSPNNWTILSIIK